jgi:hypothetical protein
MHENQTSFEKEHFIFPTRLTLNHEAVFSVPSSSFYVPTLCPRLNIVIRRLPQKGNDNQDYSTVNHQRISRYC